MTPQESQMLNELARKITSTRLEEKDPEAEQLLNQSLAHDQDALYKLAQTVLVQNIALDRARQQIAQLQQQPAHATSFLGSIFGHKDNPPPPPQSQGQYQGGYQQVPPQYAQQAPGQYVQQAPQYVQQPVGGAPSFLRSAATTAAGVAAGALAFEGVESLLHAGHGGFGGEGFGGDYGGGFGGAPREEIINNYYGSPDQGGGNFDGPNEQPQGGYDVSGPDEQPQGGYDDSSSDDSSYDAGSDFGGDDSNFA